MCYTKTVVRKYLRLFFQYNLITWKYEGGDLGEGRDTAKT